MLTRTRPTFPAGLEPRAHSVFELVDMGFRLYRRHFVYLVALAAIPNMLGAPLFLLLSETWNPDWSNEADFLLIMVPSLMGGAVSLWVANVQLVLTLLLGAAGMWAIAGRTEVTVRAALRLLLARRGAVVAAALGHATIMTALTCALCGMPVLAAIYGAFFSLFPYILFFEHAGLIPSLRRSARLARHHLLHVVVPLVIAYGLFGKVLEYAFTVPIMLIDLARHGFVGGGGQTVVGLIGAGRGIALTLTLPLVTATLYLVYCELLVRREGLDLRLRCAATASTGGRQPGAAGRVTLASASAGAGTG